MTVFIKLSKTLALCNGSTPLSCLICHPLKMNTDSALQHSCLASYFLFYIWFFLPSCGFHWTPSYLFQTLILIYPEYFKVCSKPLSAEHHPQFLYIFSNSLLKSEMLKRTGHVTEPVRKWTPTTWTIRSLKTKPLLCCSFSTTAEVILETPHLNYFLGLHSTMSREIVSKALLKSGWITSSTSFLDFLPVSLSTLEVRLAQCSLFLTNPFGYSLATC